jgi:hypothetical protein
MYSAKPAASFKATSVTVAVMTAQSMIIPPNAPTTRAAIQV